MSKRKAVVVDDDFEDTSFNDKIIEDKHRKLGKTNSRKSKGDKPTQQDETKNVKVVDIPDKQPEKKKKAEVKVSKSDELIQQPKYDLKDLESRFTSIESKIVPRNPLLSSQIRTLEELKKEVQDLIDEIVLGVINDATNNVGFGNSEYDIVKENEKWKNAKRLLSKIDGIFLSHENANTDDVKVLSEILKRKEDRKKNEQLNKDAQDREWNDLASRPVKAQIKFFIVKGGPIQGRKEFSDWKGVETLKNAVTMTSKGLSKGKDSSLDDDDLLSVNLY